ncbi:MAG: hypothetical protein RSA29_04510 [Clostridium sp.]|uniref:hypothetical protein n=1 Tax=Clostridium sp. TaxID=1506 RepID=UPI00303313ED
MKKFKCTVTRVDEYEIEIDENVIDQKWLEDFRKHMYKFSNYEEHAEHLAQLRARFGESFYEGYGNINIDGCKPCFLNEEQDQYEKAININVIDEDNECDVEIEKL